MPEFSPFQLEQRRKRIAALKLENLPDCSDGTSSSLQEHTFDIIPWDNDKEVAKCRYCHNRFEDFKKASFSYKLSYCKEASIHRAKRAGTFNKQYQE